MSENAAGGSSGGGTITVGPGLASAVLAGFLLLLIVGVWLFFHLHHKAQSTSATGDSTSQSSSQAGPSRPKPSPLGFPQPPPVTPLPTQLPATQIPLAQVSPGQITPRQLQMPAVNPNTSSNPAAAALHPPSNIPNTSMPQAFARTFSATRDGFSNGCDGGILAFSATSMSFTCPSDPGKNVSVNARDVLGVDKNGIVVASKQKFHFHIAGVQKDDTASIFSQWLKSAKMTPGASGN